MTQREIAGSDVDLETLLGVTWTTYAIAGERRRAKETLKLNLIRNTIEVIRPIALI